jgi:CheY-like chemotaxis protein
LKFHALDVICGWIGGQFRLAKSLPSLFSIPQALLHCRARDADWLTTRSETKRSVGYGTNGYLMRWGAGTGFGVMNHGKAASKRVLIVEDELMIRMLLEGMLTDLGHSVAAEAGGLDEAISLAKQAEFDVAVLDVNLNGTSVTPVVEILLQRGVPFIFASGYGQRGLPEAYRTAPVLQKPFQADALQEAIQAVAS